MGLVTISVAYCKKPLNVIPPKLPCRFRGKRIVDGIEDHLVDYLKFTVIVIDELLVILWRVSDTDGMCKTSM